MIIKNIGSKIISVGTNVLMPDDEMTTTKAVTDTPAIKAMMRKGFLIVTEDSAPAVSTHEQTVKQADEDKEAAEQIVQTTAEDALKEKVKAIKKMNRGELDSACAAAGIAVAESDTIPTLQEKLIGNLQNQQ